ncbi:hypothetical protein ABMA27_006121 [Loxostege sticticalis]|uniref:Ionotropic receptor n=1 Tax=Loxostege sticticalis TaxID=481309 RepID=A0ABR3HHP4_LOXSC
MDIIYHATMKALLKSHLSTVYIVITTRDPNYKCVEGVFDDDVFKTIDLFLNRIWHEYQMFVVVVGFPFVCPEYFVVYDHKRPSEHELYDRTITALPAKSAELRNSLRKGWFNLTKGYPLRANIFLRFPTSISECENMHTYLTMDEKYTNGMCGMDAFVMHDILRYFQFNATFPELPSDDDYGWVENNTVTGSLGQLLRDEFDISFNSRFMVQYLDWDEIQFLHYVSFDSICAMLKNPDIFSLWYYTYLFLRPSTWAVFLSLLALCSVTNKIFGRVHKSMGKKTDSSNIIDLISIGVSGRYFNKRIKASILGAICLLVSIVLYALFQVIYLPNCAYIQQGHVNYVYATLVGRNRFNTLNELHKSHVRIYTTTSFYNLIGSDFTPDQIVLNANVTTGDVLKYNNMASLERKSDVILEILRYYTDEEGWPLMYLVRQCYCDYYLSYIAKKGFPFTTEIKVYLMKLIESGLPDAYYRFTQNALQLSMTKNYHRPRSVPRPFTPSDLSEFRIAFSLLCVGYLVSTIVLVLERWWAKRSERNLIEFSL